MTRLTRLIPDEALVGYHLCHGTFPEWPMYAARDMALLVRMANFAVASSGRTVGWLHLAGPRYRRSEDKSFFRRVTTASRCIDDLGVAMYCGFGRQPGQGGTEKMREHAEVVTAVRRWPPATAGAVTSGSAAR